MVKPIELCGTCNRGETSARDGAGEAETSDSGNQSTIDRRVLRSRYLALKTLIFDEREDITRIDSDKFQSIFNQVESLHQLVQKPREQIADAEALLDITNTLVTSVKAQNREGITISDFLISLLRDFGKSGGPSSGVEDGRNSLAWKDIGFAVTHAFRSSPGCSTMMGPMNTELKQRKTVHRKRVRPKESYQPENVDDTVADKTDTDVNMAIMFNILKKDRRVRLENLVLNRNSFAQTVENLFALSFLVKDGRVEIKVDKEGCHLVSPRNAPAASTVVSGEVAYSHFVFRFDFKDWKLMISSVKVGEELMPHRNEVIPYKNRVGMSSQCQANPVCAEFEETTTTTPIKKLCRNRGLVLPEESVVEDSSDSHNTERRAAAIRKGKSKVI